MVCSTRTVPDQFSYMLSWLVLKALVMENEPLTGSYLKESGQIIKQISKEEDDEW